MSLTDVHSRLAISAVLFSLICAIWGIVNYLRGRGVTSGYWGTLAIAEFLMLAQALVGLVLLVGGSVPARGLLVHLLYGSTAVISLPAAYIYSKGRDGREYSLLYGVVCLWLFGIALRGIETGAGQLGAATMVAPLLWLT